MSKGNGHTPASTNWYPAHGPAQRADMLARALRSAAQNGRVETVHDHPHGDPCARTCITYRPATTSEPWPPPQIDTRGAQNATSGTHGAETAADTPPPPEPT